MSLIRYALLSLLAREPLSGYDIKQQMNDRFAPFWKAGSNQVYPELSKMESEELVTLISVEQHSYRPARKVYEITDIGKTTLAEWTIEPKEVEKVRDDFLIKAYNSWMIPPAEMIERLKDIKVQHEERLAIYERKMVELSGQFKLFDTSDPNFSSISVIQFGAQYERLYLAWCEDLIEKLNLSLQQQK
ncbi:PadR family transcriptional regulator [Paenibacillus sonchi]|uniref:PadR family transcriptional regulator n=1 Tax=Paenibacillus sonchi TaxID=373687 RepID=A0A974PEE2_9BACL|nr:PadR family transcriptional regulator [Paenibacillus sonchi]QQZ61986.1 PadR family transcriptional regulator [Paenibacillus sonchi]